MSPNPLITPAPKRPVFPRQTDVYDLSSFNAALSSINAKYSISIYTPSYDLSSLLAQFSTYPEYDSSLFAQYSTQDLASLIGQLTSTQTTRTGTTSTAANPTNTALSSSNGGSGSGGAAGLSKTAKIAIGVAVPVIILLLASLGVFLWWAGKRKGKKNSTTIVTPMVPPMAQSQASMPSTPQQYQPQPHVSAQNQGYTPGYQHQPVSPLPQFQQIPAQYVQPQEMDPNAAMEGYAKWPGPEYAELESSYHFAPSGAVEIGETEAPTVEEKKGWRQKLGRKPVPPPS